METDEKDDGYVEEEEDEDATGEFLYRQQSPSILTNTDSSGGTTENPTGQQMTVSLLSGYVSSHHLPFRQLAANNILDSLRMAVLSVEAYSEQDDVVKVVNFINKLSQDMDVSVKCVLLKSLPKIISFCSEYDSPLVLLKPLIITEFLPIVLKSIAYEDASNVRVRKEGYAVLKYMLSGKFVTMNDIEEKICDVYNHLLESTPNVFNIITASSFIIRMAPIIEEELTEKLIVPRITELCSSMLVKDREACVYFLVDLSCFVNPIITENIIIPHFIKLCQDEMWYVRKACAETIVMLACTCSMETRKTVLARTFIDLLHDSHNNITCCAFQQLGPFITTFSQPAVTSLANNFSGQLLLVHTKDITFEFELHSRQSLYRYCYQEKCEENDYNLVPLFSGKYGASNNSSNNRNDDDRQHDSSQFYEQNRNHNESSAASLGDEQISTIVNEIHQQAAGNKQRIVIDNLENQPDIIQSCISKNPKVESTVMNKDHAFAMSDSDEVTSTTETLEDNKYNSFLYWREPIADIDENDYCVILESNLVISWSEGTSPHYSPKPRSPTTPGIIDFRNVEVGLRTVHTFSDYTRLLPSYIRTSDEFNDDISTTFFIPQQRSLVKALPLLPKQNVIPQPLLDAYVTMPDATNLEVRRYCAYTFPAVLLTLGPSNWHHLKSVYSKLANDSEWSLKQVVANSIPEVAAIIGADLATYDLLPVYNLLISDYPDVRTTALKHFSKFLKCLRPAARNSFLPHLMEFVITDYAWDWRFRQNLSEQLTEILYYYSPADCYKFICPVAFNLLTDKVSAVRIGALNLMTDLIRLISSDVSLLHSTISELAKHFAHSSQWTGKQTFVRLCSCLINKSALPDEMFARDLLPHLLDLSWDRIPNIRIAVARSLAADIMPHPFFNDHARPHNEVLAQVLRRLENDADRDVRYFASSVPSSLSATANSSPPTIRKESEKNFQV